MKRIIIDPNCRVRRGQTFTVLPETMALDIGERVLAVEEESGLIWPAAVRSIDYGKQLVFLAVLWEWGHSPDEPIWPMPITVTVSGTGLTIPAAAPDPGDQQ